MSYRRNLYSFLVAAALFCAATPFAGCSDHHSKTVTTTEDVVTDPESRGSLSSERHVEKTETKVESDEGHHGFFHILGDIIALPFRAVGALFHAIF